MIENPFDFTGKTVFVAGGSSGINLAIAERFAAAGAQVAICSRNAEKVAAAVTRLSAHGGKVAGFTADVRQYAEVEAALKQAVETFGPIDVLISGAAGNFVAPATGISSNGFKVVVDIDLVGTFHVARAAYDHLRKPGASIINISAVQGSRPMAMQAHVCAAKAGIDQLTRVLALEWGPQGVRVNAISPGPIEGTEGMKRLAPGEGDAERIASNVPLQRFGAGHEVGDACLFLSSTAAQYITGVVLPVDGGIQVSPMSPLSGAGGM